MLISSPLAPEEEAEMEEEALAAQEEAEAEAELAQEELEAQQVSNFEDFHKN